MATSGAPCPLPSWPGRCPSKSQLPAGPARGAALLRGVLGSSGAAGALSRLGAGASPSAAGGMCWGAPHPGFGRRGPFHRGVPSLPWGGVGGIIPCPELGGSSPCPRIPLGGDVPLPRGHPGRPRGPPAVPSPQLCPHWEHREGPALRHPGPLGAPRPRVTADRAGDPPDCGDGTGAGSCVSPQGRPLQPGPVSASPGPFHALQRGRNEPRGCGRAVAAAAPTERR